MQVRRIEGAVHGAPRGQTLIVAAFIRRQGHVNFRLWAPLNWGDKEFVLAYLSSGLNIGPASKALPLLNDPNNWTAQTLS